MLCQLAIEYDKGALQMGEIGDREGISEKYLGQIMLILKSSGLVLSMRGAQGGYYLSRKPDSIGLLEVFEVLEGDVFEFGEEPGAPSGAAGRERKDTRAATNEVWARVRDAIKEELGRYNLDDVVRLGLYKTGYLDYRI
jgi:Rrf2 family cysteine metabolism transcriptional repressor